MKSSALPAAIVMAILPSFGMALDARPWAQPAPSPSSSSSSPTPGQSTGQPAPSAQPEQPGTPPVQMVYPQPYIYIPPPAPPRKDRLQWIEDEIMNMTPEEIRAFKENYRKRQAAAVDTPPEIRTSTIPVSLEPGAPFPTIQVVPGHVTSLVFLDAGGDPWPVKGVSWGDRDTFNVEPPPDGAGAPKNIIAISTRREVGATNMSVLLEGKPVPVILQVKANRKVVDARADLRLNEYGPQSQPEHRPIAATLPEQAGDAIMTAFLDGVPAKGAREMHVEGGPLRAWMLNDVLYVRTTAQVLSPNFDAVERGASGMSVYRMMPTPVILYGQNGGTGMARISERMDEGKTP